MWCGAASRSTGADVDGQVRRDRPHRHHLAVRRDERHAGSRRLLRAVRRQARGGAAGREATSGTSRPTGRSTDRTSSPGRSTSNGAEPGDMLEIQILDLNPRVPYGLNSTAPMGGVLGTGYPGFREGDPGLDIPAAPRRRAGRHFPGRAPAPLSRRQASRGAGRRSSRDEIQVPLTPFMGVMGVALSRRRLRRARRPPHRRRRSACRARDRPARSAATWTCTT